MAMVSVSEAAQRLGVGRSRVHQRIADGSLPAERIGSQWVVDERALVAVAERSEPGRPLSSRSAWAMVAAAAGDQAALAELAPVERARARQRLGRLLGQAARGHDGEEPQERLAGMLRSTLASRAVRRLFRASPIDLPDLRADPRVVLSGISAQSGIAHGDIVEAYIAAEDLEALEVAFLLVPAGFADARDSAANAGNAANPGNAGSAGNVVLHVAPAVRLRLAASPLVVAADLAEHRGPREEQRAVEILRELARTEGRGEVSS